MTALRAMRQVDGEFPTTGAAVRPPDLSGFEPNLEAIADTEPDLVVISTDPGDLANGLDALGIPVVAQPAAATLDEAYEQIVELGAATGHDEEADALVAAMQAEIDEILAVAGGAGEGLRYYHELDELLYSATSSTFIGEVYGLLGLTNIADAADDGSGFPQLSQEYIIEADSDLIFLADAAFGQDADTVAARPGWDAMAAVSEGGVVELDADLASRWGPRVVEFLAFVADAVEARTASAG